MAKKKATSKTESKAAKPTGRPQCHWVSNTHWDREWRFSMQRTRYKLVTMMDMLLDIFEKQPEFKHFHLDSQTMPLQDYLEIRPENAEKIAELVKAGKLAVGPWFCLPDEFCVAGESLIRNLQLGHRIARKFGGVSKTGYSPFGWGQISQMPQIYQGFGIDMMSFYRGTDTLSAPQSEYHWQSPDGTDILVSRLAPRPRYNVWYIVQRPVFWNFGINGREFTWDQVGGPFRLMDEANVPLDGMYIHPQFDYHEENVASSAAQTIEEQDGHWSTDHRFWSSGHDTSIPDIREVQMLKDCDAALDGADVFHSTITDWQNGVKAQAANLDLPVVTGEMHHPAAPGSASELIGWIISARTYIKQENFKTERELFDYAEPMSVFSTLLGTEFPQSFIDTASNWLLQNHGHDSIAGCSRDVIHEDMMYRYRQSQEISSCLIEQSMMEFCRSINFGDMTPQEMAVVVYNPASFKRTEVMPIIIDIPHEWDCDGFEIQDRSGKALAMQFDKVQDTVYPLYFNNNDVVNYVTSSRYRVLVELPDVPSMGYQTFKVAATKKISKVTPYPQPQTMLTGPQSMENACIAVTINANGTLTITDKATGKTYDNMGYFRDSSEIGDPWLHLPVEKDQVFTTLNENAKIVLLSDGELETSFRVELGWALPESSTIDNKNRSEHLRPYKIINTVTLRKDQPWVEVSSEVDNTVENHYLQACFPSTIDSDRVNVQGQFDVLNRKVGHPDFSLYYEQPQTEQPMNSFIDINDAEAGLALLNQGLKAYTSQGDPDRTIALTLLRCFPMKICAMDKRTDYTDTDNGGQCPGKNTFRYAVMPHAGDWQAAGLWQAAERFNLTMLPAQVGPTKHGSEPMEKSFLEVKPESLHVSAVKRSESGKGWIVRLFNPADKTVRGTIRLNGGLAERKKKLSPVQRTQKEFELPSQKDKPWKKVREITLEELPLDDLKLDSKGNVKISIGKKKIMTLEFIG